jgi:cell division transport system permease protein
MPSGSVNINHSTGYKPLIIISSAAIAFFFGLLLLLTTNIFRVSEYAKENFTVSVIIKDTVKEADAIFFQKELEHLAFVYSTKYISKEKAARDLQEDLGENFISFLGYNPLPSAIDVYLKPEYITSDSLLSIKKQLQADGRVKEVFYQQPLVKSTTKFLYALRNYFVVMAFLLLVVSIAALRGLFRLDVFTQREAISDKFASGQSLASLKSGVGFSGLLQGLLVALIAVVALFIVAKLTEIMLGSEFVVKYQVPVFAGLLVFCALCGFWASLSAVKRLQKTIKL